MIGNRARPLLSELNFGRHLGRGVTCQVDLLRVRSLVQTRLYTLCVFGELTVAIARHTAHLLLQQVAAEAAVFVLDVDAVVGCDVVGADALLRRLHRRLRVHHGLLEGVGELAHPLVLLLLLLDVRIVHLDRLGLEHMDLGVQPL